MSLLRTRLTEVFYAPASIASVYANPASSKTFVRGFMLINTDTVIRTVRIDWVPDVAGALGTATNATKIAPEIQLDPNEVFIWDQYPIVLKDTNESIQMEADAANKVNVVILGDIDQ